MDEASLQESGSQPTEVQIAATISEALDSAIDRRASS
jgi:hypothetical protein